MINFFALSDAVARLLLAVLPNRISSRIQTNTSPLSVLVLRRNVIESTNEPRMTLFEGVFATILFDMALFGTSNPIINGIIALFTTIQNSWDVPFKNKEQAAEKVGEFCNRLGIQQTPWIWEKSAEEYTSLNDFFSRTYSTEHFPKIQSGRLVSPACCKILSYPNDDSMKNILIKGCDYKLDKIGLFPEEDLEKYSTNRVWLGYLSPKDYHRVHSPIKGKCIHCKLEGADHRSASVKFFGGQFNILNDNKRLVVILEEEEQSSNGNSNGKSIIPVEEPLRVALVIVGGVGVDTITFNSEMVGETLDKGQEISTFRAGGSAFAMFSSKPLDVIDSIRMAEERGLQVEALVGETLAN
ncbi:hypothetical protein HJC23_003979 [Cyclotella cryptica]|uniref:Phosphatidylserine decarboxylase n=1 Tax=Cyclotella cryptica TaxID=29204 RepID=A0ABD3QTH9_9STRA|eukprot:CCRYP_001951-RA/>CCRYP_001951-RA protein AED:0.24 eAED:0.24 QI:132/1/1/1/1/1/3/372/354